MAKKTTAEQALSRIFNIARGMVSNESTDKETKSRMNNVKRASARGVKAADAALATYSSGGKVKPKKMMYGGKATAKKKK